MSDHTSHRPWRAAEQSFLLSTKVLISLEKMVAGTSLSYSGTITMQPLVQPKHLLWVKSKWLIVDRHLREIADGFAMQ